MCFVCCLLTQRSKNLMAPKAMLQRTDKVEEEVDEQGCKEQGVVEAEEEEDEEQDADAFCIRSRSTSARAAVADAMAR